MLKRLQDESLHISSKPLAGFLVSQFVLALVIRRIPTVGLLQALLLIALATYFAINRRAVMVAVIGAYFVGMETVWRMTSANIPWEGAKYAVAAIFLLALITMRKAKTHILAILYFALLIPSALLTVSEYGLVGSRKLLSFNLSGPLALTVCVWFFSNVRLSRGELHKVLLAYIGPTLGVATLATFGILTAESLKFSVNSNFATSGGFGPNQVSGALGLAAFFSLFCLLDGGQGALTTLILATSVVLFTGQSVLTFSRGGMYEAAGAAAAASFYLVRDQYSRKKLLQFGIVLAVLLGFVILPKLNSFTGGTLGDRFQDTGLSHRDELFFAQLRVFFTNPVLGTGPGMGRYAGAGLGHTEFSRVLAEHGSLGLLSLLCLFGMGVHQYWKARGTKQKALVVSMFAWSILFMLNTGMRLAAPSFVFGLGFTTLLTAGSRVLVRRIPLVRDSTATPAYLEPRYSR